MFAAARISAASASVIQSVGGGHRQSPVAVVPDEPDALEPLDALLDEDDSPDEPPVLLSPDGLEDEPSPPDDAGRSAPSEPDPSDAPSFFEPPSPLAFDGPGVAVARRSFFAQPDPLKWIAGAANAFLIGPPPHSGQAVGSVGVDAAEDLEALAAVRAVVVVQGHVGARAQPRSRRMPHFGQ